MRTRLVGLLLLLACTLSVSALCGQVRAGPSHPPTVLEMLLSLLAVLTGCAGAMATVIGTALFEPYTWPPKEP